MWWGVELLRWWSVTGIPVGQQCLVLYRNPLWIYKYFESPMLVWFPKYISSFHYPILFVFMFAFPSTKSPMRRRDLAHRPLSLRWWETTWVGGNTENTLTKLDKRAWPTLQCTEWLVLSRLCSMQVCKCLNKGRHLPPSLWGVSGKCQIHLFGIFPTCFLRAWVSRG